VALARNHVIQSSFTIRIDAIFTTRLEAAFTTAIDVTTRIRASACLCPGSHAD
jgi:hypothetical protein